jgi:thiosulfate reductase cytochrome b subunit
MLNPSRTLVVALALIAVVAFVLGLATDVGLFGWSLAALLVLYLCVAGMTQRTRRRTDTPGRAA